jgi:hypothetical protein
VEAFGTDRVTAPTTSASERASRVVADDRSGTGGNRGFLAVRPELCSVPRLRFPHLETWRRPPSSTTTTSVVSTLPGCRDAATTSVVSTLPGCRDTATTSVVSTLPGCRDAATTSVASTLPGCRDTATTSVVSTLPGCRDAATTSVVSSLPGCRDTATTIVVSTLPGHRRASASRSTAATVRPPHIAIIAPLARNKKPPLRGLPLRHEIDQRRAIPR